MTLNVGAEYNFTNRMTGISGRFIIEEINGNDVRVKNAETGDITNFNIASIAAIFNVEPVVAPHSEAVFTRSENAGGSDNMVREVERGSDQTQPTPQAQVVSREEALIIWNNFKNSIKERVDAEIESFRSDLENLDYDELVNKRDAFIQEVNNFNIGLDLTEDKNIINRSIKMEFDRLVPYQVTMSIDKILEIKPEYPQTTSDKYLHSFMSRNFLLGISPSRRNLIDFINFVGENKPEDIFGMVNEDILNIFVEKIIGFLYSIQKEILNPKHKYNIKYRGQELTEVRFDMFSFKKQKAYRFIKTVGDKTISIGFDKDQFIEMELIIVEENAFSATSMEGPTVPYIKPKTEEETFEEEEALNVNLIVDKLSLIDIHKDIISNVVSFMDAYLLVNHDNTEIMQNFEEKGIRFSPDFSIHEYKRKLEQEIEPVSA